jgi:hypothetical protein
MRNIPELLPVVAASRNFDRFRERKDIDGLDAIYICTGLESDEQTVQGNAIFAGSVMAPATHPDR